MLSITETIKKTNDLMNILCFDVFFETILERIEGCCSRRTPEPLLQSIVSGVA